jgi:hypothetical protein
LISIVFPCAKLSRRSNRTQIVWNGLRPRSNFKRPKAAESGKGRQGQEEPRQALVSYLAVRLDYSAFAVWVLQGQTPLALGSFQVQSAFRGGAERTSLVWANMIPLGCFLFYGDYLGL